MTIHFGFSEEQELLSRADQAVRSRSTATEPPEVGSGEKDAWTDGSQGR